LPAQLTARVGLAPTRSFSPGDPVRRHGTEPIPKQTYGYWSRRVKAGDHEAFLVAVVTLLSELPADFHDIVKSFDASADFFLGVFGIRDQSTVYLDEPIIELLAKLKLPVCFDLYVDEGDDA